MEQLLMSGFITLLLHVAASTASTVSDTVVSRHLLPVLLLLLHEHHPHPPSLVPYSLLPLLSSLPLSNPASLKPHSLPLPLILLVTLPSWLASMCSLLRLSPPLTASQ